jgi:hypothetical protein
MMHPGRDAGNLIRFRISSVPGGIMPSDAQSLPGPKNAAVMEYQ